MTRTGGASLGLRSALELHVTRSQRPIAFVALWRRLAAGAFFVKGPPTDEQRIVIERRDAVLHPTTARIADQPQNATVSVPAADARTLLKYGYLLEAVAPTDTETTEELATLLQARET